LAKISIIIGTTKKNDRKMITEMMKEVRGAGL